MNNNSAAQFLEEIQTITNSKVLEWSSIIDKMGMDAEKTDCWNDIFKKQVINLYDEMIEEARSRQNKLLNAIEMLLRKSESLCKDLHLKMPGYGSEGLSLYDEQDLLKKRIEEYEQMIKIRREEINTLNRAQIELCETLGRDPKRIPISPLPTEEFIADFKEYLESLESEKYVREEKFLNLKSAIIDIAEELKFKPNLDFERTVLSPDDSLFLVTDTNMKKLENFYELLQQQHQDTKEEILALREKIKDLWEILSEDIQSCDAFLQKHTGITLDTLQALKQELKRCEALKKANIEEFVRRLRSELINLWDKCHFTEKERDFEYLHTSLYTEDLLSLHDIEIQKLKKYYASNSDLYNLLEKRNELWSKMLELEERATAPDRYKNRGGQLLKEEKERNALSKRIPKIEEQLLIMAQEYEVKVGRPFRSWGKTIETIISYSHQNHEEFKKLKLSARKQQRDKTITPGRSVLGLASYASTQNLAHLTPSVSNTKRKMATPLFPSKPSKVLREHNDNVPRTAPPKLTVNGRPVGRSRYSIERAKRIEKCRRISQRMLLKRMDKENSVATQEYDDFKEDLGSRQGCRSTLFMDSNVLAVPLPTTPIRATTATNTPRRTPGTSNIQPRSPHTVSKLSTAPSFKLHF